MKIIFTAIAILIATIFLYSPTSYAWTETPQPPVCDPSITLPSEIQISILKETYSSLDFNDPNSTWILFQADGVNQILYSRDKTKLQFTSSQNISHKLDMFPPADSLFRAWWNSTNTTTINHADNHYDITNPTCISQVHNPQYSASYVTYNGKTDYPLYEIPEPETPPTGGTSEPFPTDYFIAKFFGWTIALGTGIYFVYLMRFRIK